MTNRRMNPRSGLVPLSIAFIIGTAACTSPTPVIRQPFSNGGSPGDGGSGFGTGGISGSFPGATGGNVGVGVPDGGITTDTGGASGAGGAAMAMGGSTGAAGGMTGAGGAAGAGGRPGTGGVSGRGGAMGSGGAGSAGMVDAGRVDTGGGSGGRPATPDAPLEASSLDVSPPPVDMGPPPNPMACMKSTWVADANTLCTAGQCLSMLPSRKEPKYAVDGDVDTRYTSGSPQGSRGAETLTITFPSPISFTGVTIVSQVGDGAAAYRLESSDDGETFRAFAPPVEGNGSDNIVVTFAARTMKALRIVQSGTKSVPWWSVHEVSVAGCTVAP
jgi:hypothetical protein